MTKGKRQKKVLESAIKVMDEKILDVQEIIEVLREKRKLIGNSERVYELSELIGKWESKLKNYFEIKVSLAVLVL